MAYTPNQSKYLTVAQTRTNRGTKDVKVILDIDTNVFYTLDDDNNFIPIAYSQSSGIFTDIDVTNIANINTLSATTYLGIDAVDVLYDNSTSGLAATDVQAAIDEIAIDDYQYQKGNAFNNFMVTSGAFGSSSSSISSNLLLAFPIYVQKDTTIDAMRIGLFTSSVGNTVIGLYTAVNGLPHTKIFQTTEFNNNVTGYQVISVGTQILKKGIYFVSYLMNSTYNAVHVPISAVPNVIGNSGITTSSGDGPSSLIGRSLTYTSTLPTTWGTPTTLYTISQISNILQVEFRIP